MTSSTPDRFSFITEWYDPQACLTRTYRMCFFPSDSTVDMYDLNTKKMFLKRSECKDVTPADLFIGAVVTVFCRQLKVVDYGDTYTRTELGLKRSSTLLLVKPDAYAKAGKILDAVSKKGFAISKLRMVVMDEQDAYDIFAPHYDAQDRSFGEIVNHMTGDAVIAAEVVGENAVQNLKNLCGPEDPAADPSSIRGTFGTNHIANAVHRSESDASASRELDMFFGSGRDRFRTTACLNNCTCAIIKPHAVKAGLAGHILDVMLEEGFEVSAMQLFNLDTAQATEFCEVYKGVVPEYRDMVDEFTSGPCIALEVRSEQAVPAFRRLTGPADPEIARHLRPHTLRAIFGEDKVKNAIHCTDLPEDGVLECEYFFKILQKSQFA